MIEIICAFIGTLGIIMTTILSTKVEMKKLRIAEQANQDETKKQLNKLEKNLDEHIAQSYRDKIMSFQTDLLRNGLGGRTLEEWNEIIMACQNYETYCKDNNVSNNVCSQAIKFINNSYQKNLASSNFINL